MDGRCSCTSPDDVFWTFYLAFVGIFLWLTVVYIPDVSVFTWLKAVRRGDTMAFLSLSCSVPNYIGMWLSYPSPVVTPCCWRKLQTYNHLHQIRLRMPCQQPIQETSKVLIDSICLPYLSTCLGTQSTSSQKQQQTQPPIQSIMRLQS